MDHDIDSQKPGSPNSSASTISCPNSPTRGLFCITDSDDQRASEELAGIQEELQNVLEYVDQGMILKSFNTLSRLTDIVATNCEKLGIV